MKESERGGEADKSIEHGSFLFVASERRRCQDGGENCHVDYPPLNSTPVLTLLHSARNDGRDEEILILHISNNNNAGQPHGSDPISLKIPQTEGSLMTSVSIIETTTKR